MKQNVRKPFYNNISFFNPLPMVDLTSKKENASFRLKCVILQDYSGFCIHCFYNRIIIIYIYKTVRPLLLIPILYFQAENSCVKTTGH